MAEIILRKFEKVTVSNNSVGSKFQTVINEQDVRVVSGEMELGIIGEGSRMVFSVENIEDIIDVLETIKAGLGI